MPRAWTWARALLLLAAARQQTAFNTHVPAPFASRFNGHHDERAGLAARARRELQDDGDAPEERVVAAIRDGFEAGWGRPKRAASALGAFGSASGELVQTWLTPSRLEDCAQFWADGTTILLHDARRGVTRPWATLQRPHAWRNLVAVGWFAGASSFTFPWTPLFLPLLESALDGTAFEEPSIYVPPAFRDTRRAALRRLRRSDVDETADGVNLETASDDTTPQNIDEGVAFFRDGTRLLLRDLRRNRLLAEEEDTAVSEGPG